MLLSEDIRLLEAKPVPRQLPRSIPNEHGDLSGGVLHAAAPDVPGRAAGSTPVLAGVADQCALDLAQ